MPATPDACTSSVECGVECDTAPSVSSPAQVHIGVDGRGNSSNTKDPGAVFFRDVEDFERKRQAFSTGGSDRLQIISGARRAGTIKHAQVPCQVLLEGDAIVHSSSIVLVKTYVS